MSHIFGLAHSVSGILDQGLGFIRDGFTGFQAPITNFGMAGTPQGDLPALPPASPPFQGVDQPAMRTIGTMSATGGNCGPVCGPKIKRYITTVCPDGSTTIREHKSRKRKRRLASMSDIKDLAALKNILGGGKAFDTWIATRGR